MKADGELNGRSTDSASTVVVARRSEAEPSHSIFRYQALAHHLAADPWRGDLLRISPIWSVWVFGFVMLAVAVGLVFAYFAHVTAYASGPAVVRQPAMPTTISLEGESRNLVTALLPDHYQGQLRLGSSLLFQPAGYRAKPIRLVIDSVSSSPISLEEARRRFDVSSGKTLGLDGPVLVVDALLPVSAESSNGTSYENGITGVVRIPVDSERLLWVLMGPLRPVQRAER